MRNNRNSKSKIKKIKLVDDEPIALEVLKYMLSSYDNIEIIKTYTNPLVAVKEIGNTNPDVVFLDIEMGGINGLEIAELFIE